jgi:hypothetical protein
MQGLDHGTVHFSTGARISCWIEQSLEPLQSGALDQKKRRRPLCWLWDPRYGARKQAAWSRMPACHCVVAAGRTTGPLAVERVL